ITFLLLFFSSYGDHRHPHSFPTRRSSDLRMPVLDGIEATRRITAAGPLPRVLILTTFDLDEYVFGALRVGASGFMLKERPPEELDRKSTRLNSSHVATSYAVLCLKKQRHQ